MSLLTRHALVRQQQRGIPPLIVDWLLKYGDEKHNHRGAVIRYFSKKSKRRLRKDIGKLAFRRFEDWLRSYLVEAEGRVITVGHRTKNLKLH